MADTGSSIFFPIASVLFLLLLASSQLVNGKRYDFTPGWVFTNNGSLENSTDSRATYRILADEKNKPIVSGNFTLAFYDPGNTENYFLSVLLTPGGAKSKPSSLAVPIWIANYNGSVVDGATLMLTRNHQKLILLDGSISGSLKWNSGVTDIKGIELTEIGNLILYGDQDQVLWESFKHPTDVLVPGQTLKTGMSVFSSPSNSSLDHGEFVGVVESRGFVLYVVPKSEITMANILRKPQPYQVWSVSDDSTSSSMSLEAAKRICESSDAVLRFIRNRISISLGQQSSCGSGEAVVFEKQGTGEPLQYMKLEVNGDLVVYEFDGDSSWSPVFNLSEKATDACRLPIACGSYGFCSKQGECECLASKGGDSEKLESGKQLCTPPASGLSTGCLTNEAENHHFFRVDGATYFSNRFMKPDKEKISEKDCLGLCSSNCSCAAAFYREESQSCFLVEELMGSMTKEPGVSDFRGFVKFQNSKLISEPLASKARVTRSARTAIVFLAVLVVCLALALATVVWIVKTRFPHAYDRIMRRNK